MLDLEVTLKSLLHNQFELMLGSPFCHCVTILKQFDTEIHEIQVWYSDQNPLGNDLVLNISKDGIRLIFDSYCQRLKMIEVYDMDKVLLRYHGKHFNSTTITPTIEQISQSFGSTTPCTLIFEENKQRKVMNFRGLAFFFAAESNQYSPRFESNDGNQRIEPTTSGVTKVMKMQIYHGSSVKDCAAPELPIALYNGVCFLESAEVERCGGIFSCLNLNLKTFGHSSNCEEFVSLNRKICFGLSCQEVASRLGAPARIFYKCDDKMRIHCQGSDRYTLGLRSDYIYNYFSLGIDLVFDGASHSLKKIVLRTNYPGHYDFNIYMRCDFTIPLSVDLSKEHRMSNPYQSDQLTVTPFTKWNDIEPYSTSQQPVVLNRTPSVNSVNPFGPTFCRGIQDMVFEIMNNKHVASVLIYQT